jgi:hypothetical protein
MNIGNTIFNQLKCRPMDLMAWGSSSFKTFDDKSFTEISHLGGLVFTVNGLKFKGQVMIRLAPSDTYVVEIGKLVKGTWTPKTQKEDIYCEDLHQTIDDLVEGTMGMSKNEALATYKKANVPLF